MAEEKGMAASIRRFEEQFSKQFGPGTLRRDPSISPYEVIPTGSLTLDYATGVGGWVEGRLHEVWGTESAGKTTLCLLGIVEAQRKYPHKLTAWVDMEHALDPAWAKTLGVDLARMHIYDPGSAEDVADAVKELLHSGLYSLVVLDSIGAMIPKKEVEKAADEATMGLQAKIVTRMVKIAAVETARTKTTLIMINQVRANLSYGADTTTGGGFALKHVTTLKFQVKRTGTPPFTIKVAGQEIMVGQEIAVRVERNKVAPRGRKAEFALFNVVSAKYGPVGIDRADEAATLGLLLGLIERAGAWYTLPDKAGTRLQGKDSVVSWLREHPEVLDEIRLKAIATRADEVVTEAPQEAKESQDGNGESGDPKPAFRSLSDDEIPL